MSSGSTSDTREESGLAIRVVLADDSHLVRAAVEHVLATAEGIEAVGSCRDRRSLSEAIEEERPDVW